MKDSSGSIIYIGKAKNLQKRVSSYFSKQTAAISENIPHQNDNWKTSRLVGKIHDVDFILTDNEIEAFLLESNLIKRYRPVFNIELKDQQRYTYLKITDETFPRLLVARRNRKGDIYGPKGKVYGPFVRGSSKFLAVGLLRKLFKIRICDKLPKKPCLEYFLKNCDAPCINNVTRDEYRKNVDTLHSILRGKSNIDKFVNEMEAEMKGAAEIQDYEKAQQIRDTLRRLNNLSAKQKMEKFLRRNLDEEYVGIIKEIETAAAHVMTLRRTKGVITDRKKFDFELIGDNSLATFLSQYYSTVLEIPRFVYVNEMPVSREALEASIERFTDHKVNIILVSDDFQLKEKKDLMDLVIRNLQLHVDKGHAPGIVELKNILRLPIIPSVIDCFDISNFGNTYAVGACTRFVDGKPYKDGYRKFKIRLTFNQNDFAMIQEIVTRRYLPIQTENYPRGRAQLLPDLIVIDGGKGQLQSAIDALHKARLEVPCISLAKENEEIYSPDSTHPVILSRNSPALKVIQYIRDEAHRFGLAYNRNLRRIKTNHKNVSSPNLIKT
ncbi:MAG: excinuclease ABC subunit C [Candidatus Nitrosopolaris wilkensis]|jgi:excinuclease ABC subunit C|nr:MAG: excinuclease ABC subunit C [Candidatus Nitrosopolaris wilkensis]